MDEKTPPVLEAAGKGLPWWETLALRHIIFPLYCGLTSWEKAYEGYHRETERILKRVSAAPEDKLTERVLIKRLAGLEDYSRYYSVAMVLEHLAIVGERITAGVILLSAGRRPPGDPSIIAVKPKGGLTAQEAVERFQKTVAEFLSRTLIAPKKRGTKVLLPHPWFGPLNAHEWMVLAYVHQRLHRRQIERIIAGLSRVS